MQPAVSRDVAASGTVHPAYRPDIDGLRAIAVLAVLGFHAFPGLIGGGFVGVDIFFVISGFLISSIIFTNLERRSFSYAGFYSRRIRRIFPALVVVLAVSFIAGWFLLLPSEYRQLGKYIAGGGGFISNFISWNEAGYFDNSSDTKPLLHLWSLGIEEQFYILWPLLVAACWRYRLNFLATTLVVALLSFAFNLYIAADHPDADFYSPMSRFWELMIGGVLAYVALHQPRFFGWRSNWLTVLGLALIAAAICLIRGDEAFPSWRALLPTAGTFLVIAASPDNALNRYLLANRAMVGVGLISYPLYLWHMPLLVFARISSSGRPSAAMLLGLLAASVVLATATYFLVERPLRFTIPARRSVTMLLVGMSTVVLAGAVSIAYAGMPGRFTENLRSYFAVADKYDYQAGGRYGTCWLLETAPARGYDGSCVDAPAAGKPLVLLWGDSHAALFYPGLRAVADGHDRLAQFTRNACPPILKGARVARCNQSNRIVLQRVATLKPDVVILFGRWSHHIRNRPDDPGLRQLLATLERIKGAGVKHIIVMGPAPNWENSMPQDMVRWAVRHQQDDIPARTSMFLAPEVRPIDDFMRQALGGIPGVRYFSVFDALCDQQGCLTTLDGKADGLTTFDYGHFTDAGARYVAQKLAAETDDFGLQVQAARH